MNGNEISQRDFLNILKQEYESAEDFVNGSVIASQRALGMSYYLGGRIGNEIKGRSTVVSRDTFETIEWILPQLLELFLGVDSAVKFEPEGQEDIEPAEQATEYVNYLLLRKNKGFLRFHDWFKDTLIQKKGYLKCYWAKKYTTEVQDYTNLDNTDMQLLMSSEGVQPISIEQQPGPPVVDPVTGQPSPLYNVKVRVVSNYGCLELENIAPENMLVRRGTIDLCEADYCGERFYATKSDMLKMGYPKELVDQCNFNEDDSINRGVIRIARNSNDYSDQMSVVGQEHESMKKGAFVEAYIRIDRDGDGLAEYLQVVHDVAGKTLISVEEIDSHPYIDLDVIRVPNKHFGLSIADVMKDIQEIKTVLLRGMLDHSYYTINGRWAVLDGQVNMTDLTNPVPGGAVRELTSGAVRRLDTPALDPSTFGLLDYVDRIRERRAGVNELQQGVDKEAMGSNVATGAMDKMMHASQQRILMIARMFAETGVKDLMYKAYSLVRKNAKKSDIVRLRGKFVQVQPMDWKDRDDMTVSVGTGAVSPREQMTQLQVIRDSMAMAAQMGSGIVTPFGAYNLAKEMVKATGRRDVDKFFSDPSDPQAPKPPDPGPTIDQQIKMQELKIKAAQQDLDEKEFQLKVQQFEWQKIVEVAEVELEDRQSRPVGIGPNGPKGSR